MTRHCRFWLQGVALLAGAWLAVTPSRTQRSVWTSAQPSPAIELVGQSGGIVSAMVAHGERTYVGVGPRVAVLDMSKPEQPQLVGWSGVLPAPVLDLAVAGDRLVVAAGKDGLLVLDLATTPDEPRLIESLSLASAVHQVVADGEYAFVSAAPDLVAVRVSAGHATEVIGRTPLGASKGNQELISLLLRDRRVYVGFRQYGLGAVDVTVPTAPRLLGWNEEVPAWTLAVGNGFVATHAYELRDDQREYGVLHILSLDPSTFLHEVGRMETGTMYPVRAMVADDRTLYAHLGEELLTVSVTDLAQPVVRGRGTAPAQSGASTGLNWHRPRQLYAASRLLYVAVNGGSDPSHTRSGVAVVRIGAGGELTESGGWMADLPGDAQRIATTGGFLVLTERMTGVMRLFRPLPDGSLEALGVLPIDAGQRNLTLEAPWLYYIDNLTSAPTLFGVDISDPRHPRLAAHQQIDDLGSGLLATHGRAYVERRVASEAGGTVSDLDVYQPSAGGGFDLHGRLNAACKSVMRDIDTAGDYLYLACFDEGLVVIDIADPDRPKRVAAVPIDARAYAVTVRDGLAYVATRWPTPPDERNLSPLPEYVGLRIIDLRTMAEVGSYRSARTQSGGAAWDIAFLGHFVLLTTGEEAIRVIDVTDPAKPTERQVLEVPTAVGDLAVAGTTAYVTAGGGGVLTIELRSEAEPERSTNVYLPWLGRPRSPSPRLMAAAGGCISGASATAALAGDFRHR